MIVFFFVVNVESINGKVAMGVILSIIREDIFTGIYFHRNIFSQEDIFAGIYFSLFLCLAGTYFRESAKIL